MASRLIRDRVPSGGGGRWEKRLRASRMPERYWAAKVEVIEKEDVRRFAETEAAKIKDWLGDGTGFYLHGPLESGKSSVAAILMKEALRRCERCLWLVCREIPGVMFKEPEYAAVYKKLLTTDLLVVDDLGAETFRVTGPAGTAFESVFRIMYDRNRSVIVTSNLSWNQFHNIYSAQAEPLVSIIGRVTRAQAIVNGQWEEERKKKWT